jgi:hypothetical protein
MEPTTADCYLRQISYWTQEILGSMISMLDFSAPIVQRFNLLFLALDSQHTRNGADSSLVHHLCMKSCRRRMLLLLTNGRFRWDGQMVRTSMRSHFLEMNIEHPDIPVSWY